MRNKLKKLLISLANKLDDKNYYDFGEPITGLIQWKGHLVVSTKRSVYSNKGGKSKWIKIKHK